MKKIVIIVTIAVGIVFCDKELQSLKAYQPLEPGGLIGTLTAKAPPYALKAKRINFEKYGDGSASRVVQINGRQDFERSVIVYSSKKPVVVLAFSDLASDASKMHDVYRNVADLFEGQIQFVSMDLLAQQHGSAQNHEVIGQIMSMQNITRLRLPLILFFKDGDLYAPVHEPTMMLQGFYSKDQLAAFIQNKFFYSETQVIDLSVQDLTRTPRAEHELPASDHKKISKKVNEKLSLGQKFLNFFRGK